MFVRSAAALAMLLAPVAGLSESRSENFLDLATRLPATLLSPEPGSVPAQIHFADHAATLRLLAALPVTATPDPKDR